MESKIKVGEKVTFPEFIGERVYMKEFRKDEGLPFELARWQPTVDAMLQGVDVSGPIFLMIDQSVVIAGKTQRRPGLHVDGYWIPSLNDHGSRPPGHLHNGEYQDPEGIILASDISACRAMIGEFDGIPQEGGDCSMIQTNGLKEVILSANVAYHGNVTLLHESLPVAADCQRTLVRLNVPGYSV